MKNFIKKFNKNDVIIACVALFVIVGAIAVGVGKYYSEKERVETEVATINEEIENYEPVEKNVEPFLAPINCKIDLPNKATFNQLGMIKLAVYSKENGRLMALYNIHGTGITSIFNWNMTANFDVDFVNEDTYNEMRNNKDLYTLKVISLPKFGFSQITADNSELYEVTEFNFFDTLEK